MISLRFAWESQLSQEANCASVCSNPPSDVGTGITASLAICGADAEFLSRGRKYMYICVVKRLGRLFGVTQRVNGRSESGFKAR